MSTWAELEQSFRALEPAMERATLDRQWGESTDELWHFSGQLAPQTRNAFSALSVIAGKLLSSSDISALPTEVTQESDVEKRWYRALWLMGGPHEEPMIGTQSKDGVSLGSFFYGRIRNPAAVSTAFALRMRAVHFTPVAVAPPAAQPSRFVRWLERENARRGVLWKVLVALATLVTAILALT